MRFSTRAFLLSFVPFAALLAASFWAVRGASTAAVLDSLRASVKEDQADAMRERAEAEQRNTRVLGIVTENPALKAGLQLLLTEDASAPARATVEDQLSEIAGLLGFDFLVLKSPAGAPLAGVLRAADGFAPLENPAIPDDGFFEQDGHVYQVTSVPVQQAAELVATLSVGEPFDPTAFAAPVVLLRNGRVVAASPNLPVDQSLPACEPKECEIQLRGERFLSVPLAAAGAYELRGFRSVDRATAPVEARLQAVFLSAGIVSLIAALGITAISSRSIVRPLAALVDRLHESAATGVLAEFPQAPNSTLEIRELTRGFNIAAASVRDSQARLVEAYLEFVQSLASALDARDPYTAGHSRRVSDHACQIAAALHLPPDAIEEIRVGALLHDIGKIGIRDDVLLKPGRLTPEEEAIIRQHPVIGRRILEGLHGFERYVPVVELHHENWDGTGYPVGLKGTATPLAARIVKVADAYDAMTSDRPYRRGMDHQRALAILDSMSATQFDPVVLRALAGLPPPAAGQGLAELAAAVERENVTAPAAKETQPV